MKKLMVLVLTAMMVLSLAACSGGAGSAETGSTESEKETTASENNNGGEETTEKTYDNSIIYDGTLGKIVNAKEPVDLVFWAHENGNGILEEDDRFSQWYLEQTGVRFIGTANINLSPDEDLNMHAADGFPSDLLYSAHDYALMEKYARQGAFINLYDYMDYMPNMKRLIEEDPLVAQMVKMSETVDGELFLFAGTSNFLPSHVPLFRQEYLDEVNNGAVPQTIPELEAYLIALKAAHADGQLAKYGVPADMEFYPFAFKGWAAWQTLPQQFGAHAEARSTSRILMKDDESGYYIGMNSDEFKAYVQTLSRWYDMGLVHADFWGLGDEKPLFASGQTGIIIRQAADAQGLHKPEEGVTVTPALQFGDEGRTRLDTRHTYFVTNGRIGISRSCENIPLAAAVLDSLLIEEVNFTARYGIVGEQLDYVGDYFGKKTYQYTKVFDDVITNDFDNAWSEAMRSEGHIIGLIGNIMDDKYRVLRYGEKPDELSYQESFKQIYIDAFNADPSDKDYVHTYAGYKPQMTDDEISESAALLQALKAYQEAEVQKFINGDASEITDSVWEDFVQGANDIAGDELVELYNAALNRKK